MTMATSGVVSAGLANPGGLAPLEEYEHVEAWLLALPRGTVMRVNLEDGTSYLTSVDQLLDSSRLGPIIDRLAVQRRLADLERRR